MGDKERILYMTFKNQAGQSCTITVESPREDLEEMEVFAAMQTIIEKNIFLPKGYDIVKASSAKIVNKDTVEFNVEL